MEKLIKKYLNGTCTPNEFDKVIDLLDDQGSEGKLFADLKNLWREIMSQDNPVKDNDQLLTKIHNQIAIKDSEMYRKRLTLLSNLLKAAAVLIIGLIISTVIFYFNSDKKLTRDIVETITTPFGAKSNFELADGSEVWLNSGSILSYSIQNKRKREVVLSGQAFFKVSKMKNPFIVKTNYGDVEVKGTSFDVKAYNDDDFETTLVEGIVDITLNSRKIVTLKPSQQSIINSLNEITIRDVNTDLFTSWKEGRLVFIKEPFHKVARQLERWYNVKIEIQGEELKNLTYTGKIEMETFREVLDLINTTTSIKYKFDNKTRVLKIYER